MKPIALFYVIAAALIETIGFGWLAVEFWPDAILAGIVVAALLICLPYTLFTGRVIDRRLRQIEDGRDGRTAAVERM